MLNFHSADDLGLFTLNNWGDQIHKKAPREIAAKIRVGAQGDLPVDLQLHYRPRFYYCLSVLTLTSSHTLMTFALMTFDLTISLNAVNTSTTIYINDLLVKIMLLVIHNYLSADHIPE